MVASMVVMLVDEMVDQLVWRMGVALVVQWAVSLDDHLASLKAVYLVEQLVLMLAAMMAE